MREPSHACIYEVLEHFAQSRFPTPNTVACIYVCICVCVCVYLVVARRIDRQPTRGATKKLELTLNGNRSTQAEQTQTFCQGVNI